MGAMLLLRLAYGSIPSSGLAMAEIIVPARVSAAVRDSAGTADQKPPPRHKPSAAERTQNRHLT